MNFFAIPNKLLVVSSNVIGQLKRSFFMDKDSAYFVRHNKNIWKETSTLSKNKSEVLVDFYGAAETLISYSYFVNTLAQIHKSKIESFGKKEIIPDWYLHKIYKSFNVYGHIKSSLNKKQKISLQKLFNKIIPKLKNKEDIFNLKVLGVWIGIDIYETYLKRYTQPTILLSDKKLWEVIKEGIGQTIFWNDYFKIHKIAAVVISHDCYLHLDIPAKIAYKNNVPVYLPNMRGVTYATKPFSVYEYLPLLRKMFSNLNKQERKEAIKWAKKQLKRRFKGEVGVDMEYSTKSAFSKKRSKLPVLKKNNKLKILICTHCFYDNPHGYGGFLFIDFYEWLTFLGEVSNQTNYDWYIKLHPDYLSGTLAVIQEFIKKYQKIKLIPSGTSHQQIIEEGINVVLTGFGTVGHEYPAFGVQVVNAGYGPHIAYNFNWNPKTIKEYKQMLFNLKKLRKKIDLEELYEFYYMFHKYVIADDFILTSYKKTAENLTYSERIGPKIYSYFLNQLTEKKHREIINKMKNFIYSGKHYYFKNGPE